MLGFVNSFSMLKNLFGIEKTSVCPRTKATGQTCLVWRF